MWLWATHENGCSVTQPGMRAIRWKIFFYTRVRAIPQSRQILLPFWPEKVRSRRLLHSLQSMHFNDLSLDTILKWFLVIPHPIENPKIPPRWCMRALKMRTRSNISGGVIYLSGVVFQVILRRSYWKALWNWPHAIYFLRIVGYGHYMGAELEDRTFLTYYQIRTSSRT